MNYRRRRYAASPEGPRISRRRFIALGSLGAMGAMGCFGLQTTASTTGGVYFTARPGAPFSSIRPGLHEIGLDVVRDAQLYVPKGYQPERRTPLLVLLHGAGRSSSEWTSPQTVRDVLDELGIAMLAPSSRDFTWFPGGPDVAFIDQALNWTFRRLNVDPGYLGLGGFSDGASAALSLGVANGDLFPQLLGFSPGYLEAQAIQGKPRIFVTHGMQDEILPFANAQQIVNTLRASQYEVEFITFEGGHTLGVELGRQAFQWFLKGRESAAGV